MPAAPQWMFPDVPVPSKLKVGAPNNTVINTSYKHIYIYKKKTFIQIWKKVDKIDTFHMRCNESS